METKRIVLIAGGVLVLGLILVGSVPFRVGAQTSSALTGTVTSAEEGPMEGVVVSAKKDGSTITISVVSDGEGHYAFPVAKLVGGHYTLAIRAAGYDLDGPGAADVAAGRTTTADPTLKKTGDLAAQLTNADWMASVPDSPRAAPPPRVEPVSTRHAA